MSINVTIPNLADSITQGTILRWLKEEGQLVAIDDPLIELEIDKANTDIPAPAAGVLHRVRNVGDVVKIGDVIATIDPSAVGAAPPSPSTQTPAASAAPPTPSTQSQAASAGTAAAKPQSPKTGPAKAKSTASAPAAAASSAPTAESPSPADLDDVNPSVRPLLIENKLDPRNIKGTGPRGRLLKEDVLRYLANGGGNGESAPAEEPANTLQAETTEPTPAPTASASPEPAAAPTPAPMASAPIATPPAPARPPQPSTAGSANERVFDANGVAREPMSRIRKRTALNLKEAQNTAAILTTYNEVDMSAIMDLRARYKERFEKSHGVSLGFMSFFARAVVLGLREFPRVNAFIDGDDILFHDYVHLGIAVSTDRGLTVPVLKHVEQMSFAKIESEIKRLATAVREGKLALQELSGGTFTITNGGVFGSLMSTPILNPPQSGILGMHAINKRAVVINDKIEIRPMMYVALSYDHRLVDGRESVSFLVRVKEYLEDPARLMLEI